MSTRLTIHSKAEFFDKSRRLLLGNRLNQWTFEEFCDRFAQSAQMPQWIGIRSAFTKNVQITGLYSPQRALSIAMEHAPDSHRWLFDEGAPNEYGRLIGEIMPDERGLYLRYTDHPEFSKVHMRRLFEADWHTVPDWHPDSKERPRIWKHARGLRASAILQHYMDGVSWDFLNEVMHDYEYPVVEFLSLSRPAGVLRWNTLFWEVRTHY